MTTLWHSWFGFWGLLVFASSLIFIAGSLAVYLLRAQSIGNPWGWGKALAFTCISQANRYLPRLLLLAIGLGLGWMGRDLKGLKTTYTLTDMAVIAQPGDVLTINGQRVTVPDRTVWIQRTREPIGQAFPFSFCPDYFPDLKTGTFIEIVTYEVRNPVNCHDVNPAHSSKLGIIYY